MALEQDDYLTASGLAQKASVLARNLSAARRHRAKWNCLYEIEAEMQSNGAEAA